MQKADQFGQMGKVVNSPPPDLVKKLQVNLIPIADVNPKITEELDANQAKQAVLEARISLIQNSFFECKEMITSEYAVKIKDVPDNLYQDMSQRSLMLSLNTINVLIVR